MNKYPRCIVYCSNFISTNIAKTCNNVSMVYAYPPLFPTTTLKVEKHVWFIYSFWPYYVFGLALGEYLIFVITNGFGYLNISK
jgi:hypothetical protein